MKKFLIVFVISAFSMQLFAQSSGIRQFTIGMDVFTDLWQDTPADFDPRTINQGTNVFGAYNFMLGNSDFSFSPGIGLGVHNLYSQSTLVSTADTIHFTPIPDNINYKKSKLTTTFLDIPLEFRFKSKSEFRIAIGFKYGFLMKAHTKYKGNGEDLGMSGSKFIYKQARFDHVENARYGFTGRIGYKWLNVYGYYQLSSLFAEGKGEQMYPISLGLTVIPF